MTTDMTSCERQANQAVLCALHHGLTLPQQGKAEVRSTINPLGIVEPMFRSSDFQNSLTIHTAWKWEIV